MAETTTMQEKVFVNPDHSSQVLYQLSELWRDKKLCDATIEVGPVKVYVHRLVLLAACPYLLTIGGQNDVPVLEVTLPMSVGLEGLNIFLTYLYDGVLNLTTSNLLSVEKLSKILKVTGIKKFCQEFRQMDQSVRETVGPCEQFVSDYSIKMTDNTMKIIFNEVSVMSGELKREAGEQDTETVETKRKKMNIDSLSSALQQQFSNSATSSRVQKSSEGSRERIPKIKISRTKESFSSNTSKVVEESDTETSVVHIKQEPTSYSDYEDDNTESYDESSHDHTQTDFVRQAPYSTQAFPEHEPSDPHNKPVVDMGGESGNVNASQMLQKIVKSMPEVALGLGTAAEMGEDNQPHSYRADYMEDSYEIHPIAESVEEVEMSYRCNVCQYTTKYKHNLTRHMIKHANAKKMNTVAEVNSQIGAICDQCGKSFKTKHGLKLHIKSKHDLNFKYKCQVCERGFNGLWNFRGHLSSHHAELRETCDVCRSKFRYKKSLLAHKKTCHGKENIPEFTCDTCKKHFSCRDTLMQHNRGAHGGKLFQCQACGKKYRWRSSLAYHTDHACTATNQ